jgi:hypothetical protein
MKKEIMAIIIVGLAVLGACNSSKNLTTPTTPKVAAKNGKHAPGAEEVNAIQAKFPGVTIEKLTAGYKIYTEGACTKCHNSNNIYKYSESAWTNILEDMSQKAKLNDSEKDAVSKYVMSIKATQPM